ncbi:DUF4331 domain-containing protein [Loktanella sp. M215]|uniref:DUF4331 domain-containing protein n=1 Tax=Loktanella sp. M215 TaxID=2675431 RepID=UPI001F36BB96|nr:DUF4331 domain-containing protein [Loktanella sp. M215]MCF7698990.1 DUF4331 domain-containing protein [Loktanella sp. M215]
MTFSMRHLLTGTTAAAVCLTATLAGASSHREAPAITETPKIDGTDFYMFRSYEPTRGNYVTFIANYQPLQAPYGGPNYFTMDPNAIYEISIDNNGDAVEDMTFQFSFNNDLSNKGFGKELMIGDKKVAIPLRNFGPITANDSKTNLNETESYTVNVIRGDRRSGTSAQLVIGNGNGNFVKPVDNIGQKSLPNYAAYANKFAYDNVTIPGCDGKARVFVGQRAEAFAVNLGQVFDLVNLVPLQGADNNNFPQYNVGNYPYKGVGMQQQRANDDLIGKANVTSIALEVPISCVTAGSEPVIGAWTTASLPQGSLEDPSPTYEQDAKFGGAWVQQSRLSAPLVNELVIGLRDKNLFNAAEPTQDSALATYVTNPTLPALLDSLFRKALGAKGNIAPSKFPRNDLVAAFLTGFKGFNQPANVVPSEMLRLNTAVPATPLANQNVFGVVAEDLAGFPNGRRPADDTVDIALRVVMGALCWPVPLGAELGAPGAVEDTGSDLINLGYCASSTAPVGNLPFTDAAPIKPSELPAAFPYLNTPLPGSRS